MSIKDVLANCKKILGADIISRLGDITQKDIPRIATGSLALDDILDGGYATDGRIVEIFGNEGCLAGDTFISYHLISKEGKTYNVKGGTIKRLYQRFNKLPIKGSGNYFREKTIDAEFTSACMDNEGKIFQNKIEKVICTGEKECFEVTTKEGHKIKATEDHKFFVGERFLPLSSLSVGDQVVVHNNTRYKKESKKEHRKIKEFFVRFHPTAPTKVVGGKYRYKRLYEAKAVYEAHMNSITVKNYINRLKYDENLDDLVFLDKGIHIHHIDGDYTNNKIENLIAIEGKKHNRQHSKTQPKNLSFVVAFDEIISIEKIGKVETFDIGMKDPFNNYIANNFVVHNSGKTTLALHAIAEAQNAGGVCAYIDLEHCFDEDYANIIGVNIEDLLFSQPDCAEEALELIGILTESGEVNLIVIDSVAGLTPRAEIEGEVGDAHMGLVARLMSQYCRRSRPARMKNEVFIIFINQVRDKMNTFGFGETTTTTGGKALRFWAHLRLKISRIGKIKKGEEVIGNMTQVETVKSRISRPYKKAKFSLIFGKGIDTFSELVDLGVKKKIVIKKGAWFEYKEVRMQGLEKFRVAMEDKIEELKKELFKEE